MTMARRRSDRSEPPVTQARFRQAALALPDVVEGAHHGHADFRAQGRVIASLHPDGEQAMVKVPPPVQQQLVARHGGAVVPASGAWGRAGCTMLRLAEVPAEAVRTALAEAWQWALAAGPARVAKAKVGTKAVPRPAGGEVPAAGKKATPRRPRPA